MRIKSVEYENFRNFKEHGKIECATDGKVTIIYGRNGDGKTTFHQLFQWIFYGQVHFNKTTTEKLYNLEFETEQEPNTEFSVMGRIIFEHEGIVYSLRRTAYYVKNSIGETKYDREEFTLQYRDPDNDWKTISKPMDLIEKILPAGLSEYFFFDGESMIADLSTKSDDSAKKLKKALYSMFDLDVLDMAIDHVGETDLKKTVLGKLYLSKGGNSSGGAIAIVRTNIENAQAKIEQLTKKIQDAKDEKDEKQRLIKSISEQIGSSKSKAEYERDRKALQKTRDLAQRNVEQSQVSFGESVMNTFPYVFISKAVLEASGVLKLKINRSKLPMGLGKTLITYLLSTSNDTGTCICGNPLCEAERKHIKDFLDLLPPKSYTSIYQDFIATAKRWGAGYDPEKLDQYIKSVIDNSEQVESKDEEIRELDAEQKKSVDIEHLVTARQNAERRIVELDQYILDAQTQLKGASVYLKRQKAEFDKLTSDDQKTQDALRKIRIMEAVRASFEERLATSSEIYSKKLQENIQALLNYMMDNDRMVSVSPEFAVKVYDSFGDESKSEGQFAITSFAYIGGIFRMLKSEEHLASKEYPLVLDGPFSKLDPNKIQAVVNIIPQFAPQIILFSKDSLQHVFSEEQIGRVYTIKSNVEQNVATIREGYLWN